MPDFSLRFPFTLQAGHEIGDGANPLTLPLGSRELVLKLAKKGGTNYVITITGFSTKSEAETFTANMWGGLAKMLIDRTVPFNAPYRASEVQYLSEPTVNAQFAQSGIIDGTADEGDAVAFRSEERLAVFGAGTPTVSISNPGNSFLADLAYWVGDPRSALLSADERLRTAIELYSASFTESSRRARFLTLVMVLEVLTEREVKDSVALALLDRWGLDLEEALASSTTADERESLDSLRRELFFRRDKSIRSRVRALVLRSLAADPDVAALARKAVEAYDARGKLVHEGTIGEQTLATVGESARVIVQRLLQALIDTLKVVG